MIPGRLGGKGWVWRPGPKAPQIYFWVDLIKESWQAMARPPIRLRNSWKSSCPSESSVLKHYFTPFLLNY